MEKQTFAFILIIGGLSLILLSILASLGSNETTGATIRKTPPPQDPATVEITLSKKLAQLEADSSTTRKQLTQLQDTINKLPPPLQNPSPCTIVGIETIYDAAFGAHTRLPGSCIGTCSDDTTPFQNKLPAHLKETIDCNLPLTTFSPRAYGEPARLTHEGQIKDYIGRNIYLCCSAEKFTTTN